MNPKVTLADDSNRIELYDVLFRYAVGAAESDGALAMLEVTVPARTLIKPHMHTREDEFTLVLEGSVSAWLVKPRSIPHAMWNVTAERARILEVVMPGGLERYFEQIAPVLMEHGPDWTKRYDALAEEFGLTILNDWTDELKERYGVTL